MRRVLFAIALAVTMAAGPARAGEDRSLSHVTIPDNQAQAARVLSDWLQARGIDCQLRSANLVTLSKDGIMFNIVPLVLHQQLDRLRVFASYTPKDEYKDSKELKRLVADLNTTQNFFQVFIDKDGKVEVASSLTFYDDLSARLFDSFMDECVAVLRHYIITPEALKLLK